MYKFRWILIILVISTASAVSNINSFNLTEEKDTNQHLEVLANEIGDKYFSKLNCVIVMSEIGLLKNIKIINTTIVHVEINSTKETCVDEVADILRITYKDNCRGYIVQFIKPNCALDAWLEIYRHPSIARHNPKFFFLPVYPQLLEYGDKILSRRETDLTQDFLISEIRENSTDWVVTISANNFYVHPTVYGRIHKLFMDEWHYQNGFKDNVDLYPDRILNLKGKPFRMATDRYLPLTSAYPLEGSEVRIAIYFCKKHNCTLEPVTDKALWGTIHKNLTADGVLGNVYNDRADVGALAVYLWIKEWYYIDYTVNYLAGSVTVMIPKPTKLSSILLPFLPFHLDMWMAFFVSLLLSALSLFLITRASIRYTRFRDELIQKVQFTTIEDSTMRAIGLAVLQQPSSRLIGDSPNRYLFTSYEFLYLVLSAMYSAELASFLTIPLYHLPIDTFHDFAQSGIHWFATEDAFTFSLRAVDEEDAKLVVDHFSVLPIDQLAEKAKEGKHGFTIERLPGGGVTETDYETTETIPMYHIMKEGLFGSPIVASIKKSSPYLEHYNKNIFRCVEHGLFLYWEGDVTREYLNSRIQSALSEAKTVHVDGSPSVILIENIQGVLLIYIIGIVISVIAFFLEIIMYKKKKGSLDKDLL